MPRPASLCIRPIFRRTSGADDSGTAVHAGRPGLPDDAKALRQVGTALAQLRCAWTSALCAMWQPGCVDRLWCDRQLSPNVCDPALPATIRSDASM